MTYIKIVYSLTGLDDDEQELTIDSTDIRDIAEDWYEFCCDCDVIRRTVEVEEETEEE